MTGARENLIRWMKFNAVGASGIGVQLATLAFLTSGLRLNYLLATVLAVEAAVLHNFLWHERFTWSDRRAHSSAGRLWKFNITTGACSLAGNLLFTKLLVEAGLSYLPANAGSIALCSIANFVINDRIVFVEPKRTIFQSQSEAWRRKLRSTMV